MKTKKVSKPTRSAPQTHEDGPSIPVALLGELRASSKRYQTALAAVEEHNAKGQFIQREAINAEAVHNHFVERAKVKFSAHDGDLIDLERGIIRRQIRGGV